MRNLCIIAALLFTLSNIFSQNNIEFSKANFSYMSEKEFEDLEDKIEDADKAFKKEKYREALKLYLDVHDINSSNDKINYKIGDCYFKTGKKREAAKYYINAFQINPDYSEDLEFKAARAYHLKGNYQDGLKHYGQYYHSLGSGEQAEIKAKIEKYKKECKSGLELEKNRRNLFFINSGSPLNSKYPEISAFTMENDSLILISLKSPQTSGGNINEEDFLYFSDIYYAKGLGDAWTQPKSLSKFNSSGEEKIVWMSSNGKNVIFTQKKRKDYNLLYSKFEKDSWSNPDEFPSNINKSSNEIAGCFSKDMDTLFFVSDNEDNSYGGYDIYYSIRENEDEWSDPKNLGAVINSEYDESYIYYVDSLKRMYFGSKGFNSVGGYDILYSELKDNGFWSNPVNMGIPLNTPGDDYSFCPKKNNMEGYYSTNKSDGKGSFDIYYVRFDDSIAAREEKRIQDSLDKLPKEKPLLAENKEGNKIKTEKNKKEKDQPDPGGWSNFTAGTTTSNESKQKNDSPKSTTASKPKEENKTKDKSEWKDFSSSETSAAKNTTANEPQPTPKPEKKSDPKENEPAQKSISEKKTYTYNGNYTVLIKVDPLIQTEDDFPQISSELMEFLGKDGMNRYTVGDFKTLTEAENKANKLKQKGFRSARVMNFDELELESKNIYTVQIFTSSQNKPESYFEKFLGIEIYKHPGKDGLYRYSSKTFESKEEAEKVLRKVKSNRYFKGAFIANYNRYNKL